MRLLYLRQSGVGSRTAAKAIDFTRIGREELFLVPEDKRQSPDSITEILCNALFGWKNENCRETNAVNQPENPKNTQEIELKFQCKGETYTIYRSRNETTLSHLQEYLSEPEIIGKENTRIQQLLGIGRIGFRQRLLIQQKAFHQFLYAGTKERKTILRHLSAEHPSWHLPEVDQSDTLTFSGRDLLLPDDQESCRRILSLEKQICQTESQLQDKLLQFRQKQQEIQTVLLRISDLEKEREGYHHPEITSQKIAGNLKRSKELLQSFREALKAILTYRKLLKCCLEKQEKYRLARTGFENLQEQLQRTMEERWRAPFVSSSSDTVLRDDTFTEKSSEPPSREQIHQAGAEAEAAYGRMKMAAAECTRAIALCEQYRVRCSELALDTLRNNIPPVQAYELLLKKGKKLRLKVDESELFLNHLQRHCARCEEIAFLLPQLTGQADQLHRQSDAVRLAISELQQKRQELTNRVDILKNNLSDPAVTWMKFMLRHKKPVYQLIAFANQRLKALTHILLELVYRKTENPEELDLAVLYGTDRSLRKISQLSPVESFVVSLSLALGFSDMLPVTEEEEYPEMIFLDVFLASTNDETVGNALTILRKLSLTQHCSIGILSPPEELYRNSLPCIQS